MNWISCFGAWRLGKSESNVPLFTGLIKGIQPIFHCPPARLLEINIDSGGRLSHYFPFDIVHRWLCLRWSCDIFLIEISLVLSCIVHGIFTAVSKLFYAFLKCIGDRRCRNNVYKILLLFYGTYSSCDSCSRGSNGLNVFFYQFFLFICRQISELCRIYSKRAYSSSPMIDF